MVLLVKFFYFRKKDFNDKRVYLFKEYLRIVKEFNPKIFLFENVKGLISMNNGKLFKMIIVEFEKLGYSIYYKLINSAEYGIPQIRNRVFIFGFKEEYKYWITQMDNLLDKYKSNKIVTVKDPLSDLPLLKPSESSDKYLSEPLK
ncbi:Modification methylase BanI [Spiroplasma sp. JKS002671]|uniref:DNA cytosine methyltransferase n=1 Tax=Spiroplasma attinicola TaxID=2904537 RepID=UPI0024C4BEFC|nr:DNA (cytosine-5-)-methyltransferase [Spiroplasma sp. JKS002671]MCL8210430.1 Modification methylase BanI [Spiroplasma sp. JKS002671]